MIVVLVEIGVASVSASVVAGSGPVVDVIVSTVTDSLSAAIALPFAAAVPLVLYIDQRVSREGFDLQLLEAALDGTAGSDVAAGVPSPTS